MVNRKQPLYFPLNSGSLSSMAKVRELESICILLKCLTQYNYRLIILSLSFTLCRRMSDRAELCANKASSNSNFKSIYFIELGKCLTWTFSWLIIQKIVQGDLRCFSEVYLVQLQKAQYTRSIFFKLPKNSISVSFLVPWR